MSEVALPIGGRTYRVACAAGEEERVTRLGALVADKLAAMGNLSGHEAQNLLFAALLLADEAHEGRDAVARAAGDVAAATAEARAAVDACAEVEAELAQAKTAERGSAASLEQAEARIAELRESLSSHETEAEALRAQIGELEEERNAPGSLGEAGGGVSAAELAPALERLAEMLEDCADKLEQTAAAP